MNNIIFPFNQPFLEKTADLILDKLFEKNRFNLSEITIILSGKRAQRRLLEILAEKTASKKTLLTPPNFMTPKSFCSSFAEKFIDAPAASTIEQTIAWINAASKCEDAINSILVNKTAPKERDFFHVAQMVMPLHTILSGENLSIKLIAKSSLVESIEEEKKRWSALAEMENQYHKELEKINLIDPYKAIYNAISAANINKKQVFEELFVVNVVDSFKLFREAIQTQSKNLTIISYGDKKYFDNLGFLKTEDQKLTEDYVNFQKNSIKFCNSPNEQAEDVLNIICDNTEKFGYGDFVISAPDSSTHRPTVQMLESVGISCHNAAGISFKETEIGCILSSLANCLEKDGCEMEAYFVLTKHPLVENYIIKKFDIKSIEEYNKISERIFKKVCKHKIKFINKNILHFFDNKKYPLVKKIPEAVFNEIVSPLAQKTKINKWPEKINAVLKKICSSQINLTNINNESVHQDAVEKWLQLSEEILNSKILWGEICDARTALLRFLSLMKNTSLIPKSIGPVIDMTGWLEIALDDAPVTIVTGFNEGIVPEKLSADPFLPNSLREKLNLPNYNSRFLRDKYLTKCITEKKGKCYFIAGRRSAENDPLKPGKILFCQNFERQARLLKEFYAPSEKKEKNNEKAAQSTNYVDDKQQILSKSMQQHITSLKLPENIELNTDFLNTLSVSSINDYLSCPFKFFLKRIHKIYAPGEFSNELEPLDIGNIIHKIINKKIDALHSDKNDNEIINSLLDELNNMLVSLYGEPLNPAIQIQRENLKRRIEYFVPVFREEFNGWEAMKDVEGKEMSEHNIFPEMEINREKIKLKGVIDLIEKSGNDYKIIDFKTGSNAKGKNDMFASKKEQWKDVQLILYALWFSQNYNLMPEIGFFNIPPDVERIKYTEIDFEEGKIEEAILLVRNILTEIIDNKIPLEKKFCKTENMKNCQYCDYIQICER